MINWIIVGLILSYSVYVLIRFWRKSKQGSCAGCSVQSDGQTPAGCPGCAPAGLSEDARKAMHKRDVRRPADRT